MLIPDQLPAAGMNCSSTARLSAASVFDGARFNNDADLKEYLEPVVQTSRPGVRVYATSSRRAAIPLENTGDSQWNGDCNHLGRMDASSEFNVITDTPKAVSRRKFIKGVIAGGAAVSSASYLFRSSTVHGQNPGGERLITITVNGRQRRVDVMKQETLAWTLRYKLGLTGTKLGCDRAECGACTVLIGDVPHYSCSMLTHTVRNRHVTTIEGLAAADGTLHPVQQGIIDEQGFQCAFCMSGFTMATVGFLKTNPNPTRAELAHGISGNLCRCQDYDKILTAMMKGAANLREANGA
jgi:aerobic-type carbon monoxide dehydrogenase small subunit (CoxS/CutS family)